MILEDKARRGRAIAHLGDLAQVRLYGNDRYIKQISYREQPADTAACDVPIRRLYNAAEIRTRDLDNAPRVRRHGPPVCT